MINGENVYLRLPELSDLEVIYKMANIEENRVFLNLSRPLSKMDEESWIKKGTENANNGSAYSYLIVEKKSDKVVGNCLIDIKSNFAKVAEIGLLLDLEHQNMGYGPEAIKLLLKYGFNNLNLNLIVIEAFSNNERAIHVYKDKLKFKEEARLRMRHYKNGKYLDSVVLSMNKEEYEEIYGGKE